MPTPIDEADVQVAIIAALSAYCEDDGLTLKPPYASQQNATRRGYCSDIIGLLGHSAVLLLEVKHLLPTGVLNAFDQPQYEECLQLERWGLPIAYAYDTDCPLAYHEPHPRRADWAAWTLQQIKRSVPSELPGKMPAINTHPTLKQWIDGARGEDVSALLGKAHGAITAAHDLRNGVLLLLYAPDSKDMAILQPDDLDIVVEEARTLFEDVRDKPRLRKTDLDRIERMLDASPQMIARFRNKLRPKPGDASDGPDRLKM